MRDRDVPTLITRTQAVTAVSGTGAPVVCVCMCVCLRTCGAVLIEQRAAGVEKLIVSPPAAFWRGGFLPLARKRLESECRISSTLRRGLAT